MHGRRQARREELAGTAGRLRADAIERCPSCRGRECARCGGTGYVRAETPEETGDGAEMDPGLAEAVGAFLAAWMAVEAYGVEGWLRMDLDAGRWGPHPRFLERLRFFDGELYRLEHEQDVRDAEAQRRKRT